MNEANNIGFGLSLQGLGATALRGVEERWGRTLAGD